jgi:glycine betaine/proline transport system ATP-binding protein
LEQLQGQGRDFAYILDKKERYQGVVSVDSLIESIERGGDGLESAFLREVHPVRADTPLQNLLSIIRQYDCPVPVTDKDKVYLGVISKNSFLRILEKGGKA